MQPSDKVMEEDDVIGEEHKLALLSPPLALLSVAIAINGNRKSKYIVRWVLDKFISEENIVLKLLHVRPRITSVPTPMGNYIPISQVRADVATAYKKEVEWQTSEMLLSYKKMCLQRKVQVDVLMIEADDVANAIAKEISRHKINKLVIGAARCGIFSKKVNKNDMSFRISACTPSFCSVYAISKGKLSSIRPSDLESNQSIKDDKSEISCSTDSSSSCTSSSQTVQRFLALSSINQALHRRTSSIDAYPSRCHSLDVVQRKYDTSSSTSSNVIGQAKSQAPGWSSLLTDNHSCISDQASHADALTGNSSTECKVNINFELEKLRIELRHMQGMYKMAQLETLDASCKLKNLNECQLEEETKLKNLNLKEEEARELAIKEKDKYEVAKREVEYVRECLKKEASQRREAERNAARNAKEKEKFENAFAGPLLRYQKFTWEEIATATSSFSENNRIGMGAYGTVYKCNLHHTTAAVKVLHSKETKLTKQFNQELEILSNVRHPHLLLLLGACPEHGCLVYEYMENGSLEDRLLNVKTTSPIPWFERYRIAWEVASALVFLHNSKPKPIVHRDLKPANILLDHNFVSKISDVGLSTMVHSDPPSVSDRWEASGVVGTLCYIDPEYQRTGLVTLESDVYAFGMVILQLLTAKPAIALAHKVETAINSGNLGDILDLKAGSWPKDETWELARLGLSCAELRRRDRPDLKDQVLPALERLKQIADRTRNSISSIQAAPPNHFICPILKDVMKDPCVAADGYTYERKAIEKLLEGNETSPMTKLELPNKNILPNYTLLFAIMEWNSRHQ